MANDLIQAFSLAATNPETEKQVIEWRNKIQNFTIVINAEPAPQNVRERNGQKSLPISHVETLLDELFFGQWSTTNFKYQQVANEIMGSITLEVLHPISGVWIKREGAAAVQIMQDSGATIDSIMQTKKKNALETGFPKLKAMCVKNAAKSISKMLGRDLARKSNDTGSYTPIIQNTGDWRAALQIIEAYAGNDKEDIRAEALEKRQKRQLTDKYVEELRERCNANS